MKKFSIIQKSTGNVLDHGNFQTEADGYIWFQPMIDRGVYGQKEIPERKELMTVLVSPSELIKEAVLDEVTGEELETAIYSEAIYEEQEVVVQEFVPSEYEIVITDITEEIERQSKIGVDISRGESIKSRCEKAISLIISYNSDFSFEEIDQLESDFGEIYNFLMKRRIDKAYFLLNSAQPTELITQEFLNQLKSVLIEWFGTF